MDTAGPGMRDSIFELEVPKEFSFAACLDYLNRSPNECLFRVEDTSVYKPFKAGGNLVLTEIRYDEGLQLRFLNGVPDEAAAGHVVRYVRDWFDLDTDLDSFYLLALASPLLGPLVQEYYGLRLIGVPDLFEALCWAVIGQQITLAFAYTLKRRFVESYGECMEWEGRTFRLFPEPERIAGLSPQELRQLQLSANKAAALIEIARLIASGTLSKERLLQAGDFQAAAKQLTAIRGIGPWTAHYVMMRCLRDPCAFPVGDAGLQNAVKRLLRMDRKPAAAELQELFAEWRGWEAYATFYLWRSLY
jgi:DNA-3-methyladenine glycosylase II